MRKRFLKTLSFAFSTGGSYLYLQGKQVEKALPEKERLHGGSELQLLAGLGSSGVLVALAGATQDRVLRMPDACRGTVLRREFDTRETRGVRTRGSNLTGRRTQPTCQREEPRCWSNSTSSSRSAGRLLFVSSNRQGG